MIPRLATLAAIGLSLAAARSDPLAGRTAGAPEQCLDLSRVNGPEIIDAQTILYRQSGRRIWLTRPIGSCRSLRPMSRLIVEPTGYQLCRNDRFRTYEPGDIIPSAYCRFGAFVPYDKP